MPLLAIVSTSALQSCIIAVIREASFSSVILVHSVMKQRGVSGSPSKPVGTLGVPHTHIHPRHARITQCAFAYSLYSLVLETSSACPMCKLLR